MKAVKTLCALENATNYQQSLIVLSKEESLSEKQKEKLVRAAKRADKVRKIVAKILG